MPDKSARGRFVWHELMVPNATDAHQFYGKVTGWKTQAFEGDPNYQMFATSSGPLAGTVAHAEGPPHWLPFLGSTDIDATVKLAQGLGATLVTEVTAIANGGGRWARLTDPQGVAFGVYDSGVPATREKPPKRGEFSWHELMTADYKAAFDFYSQVFGWEKAGEQDMGPQFGMYFMFGRNGVPIGGMFNLMPQVQGGPAWSTYIRVKDVHKAVKKAKAGGATLIHGPMEVPGGDWVAQFIDPQGAMFAVHTLAADLTAAKPAAAPAPEQTTLDFPPVTDASPEQLAVSSKARAETATPAKAAQQSTTQNVGHGKSRPAKPAKKTAAKAAARPTAKKKSAPKKKSGRKVGAAKKKAPTRKLAKKKSAKKKSAKQKSAALTRAKKPVRKVAVRKAKEKARRAK